MFNISCALRTKDAAIQSNPAFIPNFISSISFSVGLGRFISIPGIFILLVLVNFPPSITWHTISVPFISVTFIFISPSFIKITVPALTSLYKFL